jgi:hypothetical protein
MDGKIKIIILFIFLLICNIFVPKIIANKEIKIDKVIGPKLLTKKQINNIHHSKIFIKLSRKLTDLEIKQIYALPNNFNLSKDNVRIIDLDSILNGLKKYIGANRFEHYKNLSKPNSNDKFLSELKQFFENQPFQEFPTDPDNNEASDPSSGQYIPIGPEPKGKHDENKTKNINNLMNLAKNLIDNEPARHSLVVFMALHEFNDILTKSSAALGLLSSDKTDYHMVRFYFAQNMDCRVNTNNYYGNTIFLDFLTTNKSGFCTLPKFSDNTKIDYFTGLSFVSDKKFTTMFHEFGHSWYVWLSSIITKITNEDLISFEKFRSSEFLCALFPMCKNLLFSKEDIKDIITNDCKGNENDFINTYMKNIIDKLKCFDDKPLNISENLTLLNAAAYNKIWSNPNEIAQVLGLDKMGNIIFVNRLSDFDYSVADGLPFRAAYYCSPKVVLVESHKLKFQDMQITVKNFYSRLLTKIKKLRDHGIETIIPSENALRALFILHGKDFDAYQEIRQKYAPVMEQEEMVKKTDTSKTTAKRLKKVKVITINKKSKKHSSMAKGNKEITNRIKKNNNGKSKKKRKPVRIKKGIEKKVIIKKNRKLNKSIN